MKRKYCTVCDWSVEPKEEYSRQDMNELVLKHFRATGHSIESGTPPPPKQWPLQRP